MKNKTNIEPGTHLFSVATGRIDALSKASRKAVKLVSEQEGFIGVNPTPDNNFTLWLFDTKWHAQRAKNIMEFKGIECGNNICEFEMQENDTISFVGVAAGKDQGKGYVN